MALNPLLKMDPKLPYFEDSGTKRKRYPLIMAIYHNDSDLAEKLIRDDPAQINDQDPYAGLTPLHIAIFRQNLHIVQLLVQHPQINFKLKDNFARRIQDMLDYTTNDAIHRLVLKACYSQELRRLENEILDQSMVTGAATILMPKGP